MNTKNKTILGLGLSLIFFIILFVIDFNTNIDPRIKRGAFGGDTLIGYILIRTIFSYEMYVKAIIKLLNYSYYPLAVTYIIFAWIKRKDIGSITVKLIKIFYKKI